MADGKLYIVITDKLGTGGEGTLDNESGAKKNEKKSELDYVKHRFFNFIESQAKQTVMYGLNNVGNFTGDYVAQRKINENLRFLNISYNIGMATIAGAKIGGLPGAIAGAVISVASEATNSALQYISGMNENRKTNYNIAQLRARSGLNITLDGSRGTEN